MKKFFVLLFSFLMLALGMSLMALAQSASLSPVPVIAPAASGGISAWLLAHGGFMIAVSACAVFLNTILSAVRQFLYWADGVAPGAPIPADYKGLNAVNVAAIWVGKIVDWLSANTAH